MQVDIMLQQAFSSQNEGDWLQAANIYEYIANNYKNEIWMKSLAANALYNAGNKKVAADLCIELNHTRPTVSTLLLEAKIRREDKEYDEAIELLQKAERTIEGQECLWI